MKIIIIDPHASAITAFIKNIFPELDTPDAFTDADLGIKALRDLTPDISIVNIDMAGMDPFSEFRDAGGAQIEFIFLSEWTTFAYEAFRFGAADFLLSPVNDQELLHSVEKTIKKVKDNWLIKSISP